MDENEPWLLVGIANRDPFFVTQYFEKIQGIQINTMKKVKSLHASLHVMLAS